MEILAVIILVVCLSFMMFFAIKRDKQIRDIQYKKFIVDISEVFYAAMNDKNDKNE